MKIVIIINNTYFQRKFSSLINELGLFSAKMTQFSFIFGFHFKLTNEIIFKGQKCKE